MAKIPETGKVTIGDIATEFQGPKDLAELSKKPPLNMSGTEQVDIDDFRGKIFGGMVVSGGNQIYDQDGYRYHKFTSNGTLTVATSTSGVADEYLDIDCLIVAGGGAGGSTYGASVADGAGGAGGFVTATKKGSAGTHSVIVGAGGGGFNYPESVGSSASGFGSAVGGGGVGHQVAGLSGGSGAGGGTGISGNNPAAGNGTSGQGNKGGSGYYPGNGTVSGVGGGGGAGQAGGNAGSSGTGGKGGNGKTWLDGVAYAGGGGGGRSNWSANPAIGASGGTGGGGNGASAGQRGQAGANGLGGGGGVSCGTNVAPDNWNSGGTGVVIFRYKLMPGAARSISPVSIDAPVIEGPPYAEMPDYDPSTHKPVAEQWVDPHQKEIGWTVVELTDEEKAAYAENQGGEE